MVREDSRYTVVRSPEVYRFMHRSSSLIWEEVGEPHPVEEVIALRGWFPVRMAQREAKRSEYVESEFKEMTSVKAQDCMDYCR